MNVLVTLPRRSLAVWLAAFFSPAVYFLLMLFADTLFLPSPPETLVALLFYLIPPAALLVCGAVVWSSSLRGAHKIGWMLGTLFGMLLQFGILLGIFVVAAG